MQASASPSWALTDHTKLWSSPVPAPSWRFPWGTPLCHVGDRSLVTCSKKPSPFWHRLFLPTLSQESLPHYSVPSIIACVLTWSYLVLCISAAPPPHWNTPFTQFSPSVVSNSLWPHGLQHTRPPCPSPTPRACSNSCPLSQWCHPTISSSTIPFFSCLQSFPASGSFPMSQFFTSDGQSIGASASASVLPMNRFPLGWTALISLQSKGLSRVFSNTTVQKHQFFGTQLSLWSNSHFHTWLLEKP